LQLYDICITAPSTLRNDITRSCSGVVVRNRSTIVRTGLLATPCDTVRLSPSSTLDPPTVSSVSLSRHSHFLLASFLLNSSLDGIPRVFPPPDLTAGRFVVYPRFASELVSFAHQNLPTQATQSQVAGRRSICPIAEVQQDGQTNHQPMG
jgi:hypothetical protein